MSRPSSTVDRRDRVLVLIKGFGLGGAERLLALAIPHLDRSRFEYEFAYLTPWKQDLVPEFENAGFPVTCLDSRRDPDPRTLFRLRRLLRQRRIDLLHTHSPYPAVVGRLVAPFAGVRAVVHTEHSLPESRRGMTRLFNRLTYPLLDATIAVSEDVAGAIRGGRFVRPREVRTIYGGVDEALLNGLDDAQVARARAELGIPSSDFVVGNVGHLRTQKGHTFFLQAARMVLDELPDTTFVIVGREKEPGIQGELEGLAHQLGIGDKVLFAGFRPDPYPILGTFDVFMMSSLYEGLPIALIEAMALGKPVIATDVGGIREAVDDGRDGLLVAPRDPGALAAKVTLLRRDPTLRQLLSAAAKAKVRDRFSIRAMVGQVEALYQELLVSCRH